MSPPWSDAQIETFVRDTLGCGCPDRVFEKIERATLVLPGSDRPLLRLVIGDTLLIYLLAPTAAGLAPETAWQIADTGRGDRDRNGYNRFRLVLAERGAPPPEDPLATPFAERYRDDGKMHLHRVAVGAVAGLVMVDASEQAGR